MIIKNVISKYCCLGLLTLVLIVLQVNWNLPISIQTPVFAAVTTETTSPTSLVQAGKQHYQAEQFTEAIALWQQASEIFGQKGDTVNQAVVLCNLALAYQQLGKLKPAHQFISQSINLLSRGAISPSTLAQALNIQGSLQMSQGEAEEALTTWEKATDNYQKLGDETGVNRSLLNQTQALRVLGLYPRARKILEQVNQNLQSQPDSVLKASSLLNLGDTLRVVGDGEKSQEVLQQSLAIAKKFNSSPEITLAFLSLGNTAFSQQQNQLAYNYYQQAITTSTSPTIKLQAQLNQLHLLLDTKKSTEVKVLIPQIQPQLEKLPPSRTSIYAQVKFAQGLQKAGEKQLAAQILATAIQQAKNIDDNKAESYALGYLGKLYEQNQQWNEAQRLTEQALILAQSSNAAEISYLWQWQLGRIFQAIGNSEKAIDAYNQSVKTLAYIRKDLVAGNNNLLFSFQESIEPIYRELVSLLLQPQKSKNVKDISQTNLLKARDLIESLKVAELDNYFQEDCLSGKISKVEQLDPQAAIIYPIILRDRLEVILSLTNQPIRHYTTNILQSKLENILLQMRSSLRPNLGKQKRLAIAQKLYNLLIRPTEADLAANNTKTLVFVLDGVMKNLPMAALYDGKEYLIEKYSLAQTPGLQLLSPQPIQKQPLKILIGGISEARQGFSPLPGVGLEVKGITSEIPTQILFNQTFTSTDIQNLIRATPFPIVHLATHGQFSSNAQDTFILTWDNRLNVKELGELLQNREQDSNNPIELLVLSACQTAKGDNRAPLGIAGVAVRSGARSTLATLWSVDDASAAEFMVEFYRQLVQFKVTKAEAIRLAQIKLLKQPEYSNPFYWAPFVLLGNWL
ncbi:CHAT domain-containing protein [Anabaena sphaerica FACHB-251]|uniref:CHAT domain-containing protein n=1 Tax=Anabaena sphaerica FACHB-251 TaxID=2692883 RepID=A0A927A2W2_9NOST|nr:CHAT domain-containing protein [Anabaena sphaerica]MBD2295778.1 CHAT domain-containing protein [Anabaena sphaerica FACHB-251]